ncbi:MAG: Hsp33 family molecular chaperone HslO [Desulforhopalus sp.]
MTDTIERVISLTGNFFGVACTTRGLVNEACRRHDVGPTAAAALGRALTGAVLLAALMKDNQSILLKFEGNGPLSKIITEAGFDGWVRGYVANPHAEVPLKNGTIDVAGGIGRAGFLTVVKDIGDNRKYSGTIQLYNGQIGEDLAYYLSQSEQTPSAIALATHLQTDGSVGAAGGFLIQSLPPADETVLAGFEQAILNMQPLSKLLLSGSGPGDILSTLFNDVDHKKIDSRPLSYSCSCSRQKMEGALVSLGTRDLRQLMENEGGADVRCEFCRQEYRFDRRQIDSLLEWLEKKD